MLKKKKYLYFKEKRGFFKKNKNFKNYKTKEVNISLIIFHDPTKIKPRSVLGDLKRSGSIFP